MAGGAIAPAEVPVFYKNTIEDLLLAILNTLPAPNGNAATFLNGTLNWSPGGAATGLSSPPSVSGSILYGDAIGAQWLELPRPFVVYDNINDILELNLLVADKINFGASTIANQSGYITFNTSVKLTELDTALVSLRGDIKLLNKAANGWLSLISRDTTGAEARANLSNIKNINAVGENLSVDYTNRTVYFNGAAGSIGNKGAYALNFLTNDTIKWLVYADGKFGPSADATYDIGTSSAKVKDIYAAGTLFATHLNCGSVNWDLGNLVTAAVTLNTTRYLSVTVNGTVYKLLTAT